jgi:predicted kinase
MMIIVFGLPGTGKSTFARALASQRASTHLNTDVIRSQAGLRGQYDAATKAKVYQLLFENTEQLIKEKKEVILDGTFYTAALRKPYQALAIQYQQPLIWIQTTASEATVRERVSKKRVFSEADFAVYQKVKAAFEPLEEEVLTLTTDQLSTTQMLAAVDAFIHTKMGSL